MKLSVLDQMPIFPGQSSAQAVMETVRLARHLEAVGFTRHWLVEHHGVAYETCADPMLMALALARETHQLRIGVGGVLLNNYSPYKVAETAKTLAALAPGRIDLGIGQSSSGARADLALQADRGVTMQTDQEAKLNELLGHLWGDLAPEDPFSVLEVLPGVSPPMPWVMAVTENSARRAAQLGLPLALSAFHKPELAQGASEVYRKAFRPSGRAGLPQHATLFVAVRLTVGETLAEAEALAMPLRWAFDQRRRLRQMPGVLPTVEQAISLAGGVWPRETSDWPMYGICTTAELPQRMALLMQATQADEIMLQDGLTSEQLRHEHYSQIARALL